MHNNITKELSNFIVAGINYKKSDAGARGLFALNNDQYARVLTKAKEEGIDELFILSTCNRTEIYGFAPSAATLINLLCSETVGDISLFNGLAYIKQGEEAVQHLYEVAAGLDSQILGDYEVISQVKNASKFAKQHGCIGTFTERMINSVLQVSKIIKNETALSSGTVSVAFAAVQYLKGIVDIADKNILLLGTGKIGRNTCRNMMDYLGTVQVTLVNRTDAVAKNFAAENNLRYAPYEELSQELGKADIILVATNAQQPTILKSHLQHSSPKIIIDLSVPNNVAADVTELAQVRVINVDELSKVQDETLQMRQQEIPKAMGIIEEYRKDFLYWFQMRKHAVVLQAVKAALQEIHAKEIQHQKSLSPFHREEVEEVSSRIIQKVINMMASRVRQANGKGDHYIQLISEIFETPVKS